MSSVYALDLSGSDLYIGGDFTDAAGIAEADYVARRDGSAWHALGSISSGGRALSNMVNICDATLEAEYLRDSSLHVLGFSDALRVLRERLVRRESDLLWTTWLSGQRTCADIRVFDGFLHVPSSTPGPACRATVDG